MSARERELRVQILGDSTGAKKAFAEVESAGSNMGSKLKGIAGTMAGVLGAIGIDRAVTGIAEFGKASLEAFRESEQTAAKLEAAFAKSPKLIGASVKEFEKLNEQLATKTKFDDDATASGEAVLAQFDLTAEQIKTLVPLMQDYASWTGKDLPAAAEVLGKAIMGQARPLKEIGLELADTGNAAGNFGQLVDGLRDKVGGFAEKEGKTSAGQMEILRNRFGELQETIGSKLAPVLQRLAKWFSESVVPWLERSWAAIKEKLQPAFVDLKKTIEENRPELEKLAEWLAKVAEWVGTKLAPAVAEFIVNDLANFIEKISALIRTFEKVKETVENVFSTMRSITAGFVNFFTQQVIEPILRGIERMTDAYDKLPAWARPTGQLNFDAPEIPVVPNTPNKTNAIAGALAATAPGGSYTVTVNAAVVSPETVDQIFATAERRLKLQRLVGAT